MKKWLLVFFVAFLALSLTACKDTNDSKSNESNNKKDLLTSKEVLGKVLDRQNQLKSLRLESTMEGELFVKTDGWNLASGFDSDDYKYKNEVKADIINNPYTMHVTGQHSLIREATGEIDGMYEMNDYVTGKELYNFDKELNTWYKFSSEETRDIFGSKINNVLKISNQLKSLETFIDSFNIEEKDDNYILTLNKVDENFGYYIFQQEDVERNLGLSKDITNKELEIKNIKDNEAVFVLKINKETFDVTEMKMLLDMTVEFEGGTLTIKTNTFTTFSNFNNVPEINVPQEVIDTAKNPHE